MSDNGFLFNTDLADALHLEDKEHIQEIEIKFHTDTFARLKVTYEDRVIEEKLPAFGIVAIADALGLPYVARELVIRAKSGEWTLAHYHYEFAPQVEQIAKVLEYGRQQIEKGEL